jgi:hypothetical protein
VLVPIWLAAVPLADARAKAAELHKLARAGVDPLAQREADAAQEAANAQQAEIKGTTFRTVAERYLPWLQVVGRL